MDVIGNVGGLSLFWKKGIDFFFFKYLIACLVYSEPASKVWMLLLIANRDGFGELI